MGTPPWYLFAQGRVARLAGKQAPQVKKMLQVASAV